MNNTVAIVVFTSVSLFLSACSTLPPVEDDEVIGHVISIGRDGELEELYPGKEIVLNPGDGRIEKYKRSFDRIFEGIRTFPKDENGNINVLIYIHGGLNTKRAALETAQDTYKLIKYAEKEKKYPVFVIWRSGPISTYSAHLNRIRQGEISSTAPVTALVYLLTDLGNSIINTPKSWVVQGEHSVESTFLRDDEYLNDYKTCNNGILFTGNSKDFSSFWRSVQWLGTSPIKVVTTPFTYTMARPAWNIMSRRTNTLFLTPSDYLQRYNSSAAGSYLGSGSLSKFLIKLSAMIEQENLSVKITLIGHSLGAMIVNKMLNLGIDLPYQNIIHMASADSIRNLFEKVVPYIQKHDANFYSLSLHPENEDREASAWGLTPSGSLLVWIDNMFTTPETLLDKRSGRWENMERVLPMLPRDTRKKMHFKIFGLRDEAEEPQEPGSFGDFEFWTKGNWWDKNCLPTQFN